MQYITRKGITRSKENDACLFERRLGDTGLSQGQKALLMFCMAVYAQATQLHNLIILIDEPENHLHPAAVIEVIEKISQHVTNGQLWIATHSVPLLGHFVDNENAEMWYVEDGGVEPLGKKSEKVLRGLLGDTEEQARMRSFLDLPAQQAFDTFCYQCLFEPDVVMTDSKDPQTKQIYDIIQERINEGESVRVLDFGAGKGRLLAAIHALWDKTNVELKQCLDYIAYDVTDDSQNAEYQARKNSCCEILAAVYGASAGRYFNDKEALKTSKNHHSFDIVILCNVFHEIPPEDWLKEFDGNSLIYTMLKPEGHLVIVEDQHLAVGETAHKYGFLVFDKPQFRTLFAMKEKDEYEVRDASSKKNGRLQAHIIPAEYLPRITSDTKKDALKSLAAVSEKKISELRLKAKDYSSGKLYAFWVQQYANAKLALEL
ncbi:MAG: AAA family ATPase [Candidatus Kapaibacteriota bacterium]